jgi:hypothetical protein
MKTEIANKIETMLTNEEKHLDWLQSNNAPQEFIELSKWHIVHYAKRLKEYRESLATPQKEWKTFMIEIDWSGYTTREIVQCESLEIAERHYNGAMSIIEVRLNIEPANN